MEAVECIVEKNDWKVIARGDMGETGKWGENEDLLFLRL